MIQKKTVTFLVILGISLFMSLSMTYAAEHTKPQALEGVDRAKTIFDVTLGNPESLAGNLGVIDETLDTLNQQGVEADLVVAFRGPAVRFTTADTQQIPANQREAAQKLARSIEGLAERGVRFESCGISARALGVDQSELVPGVKAVANTFVSLIGYQAKGYGLVPIR